VRGDSTETRHQELQLLTGLGVALWPRPESEPVWTKALAIAEQLGDLDYRLRALWGLWIVCVTAGNHRNGLSIARDFAALAAKTADPLAAFAGDRLIGSSLHYLGEQRGARRHLNLMLNQCVSGTTRIQIERFQYDQSVARRAFLARTLWLQGLPDQAMQEAEGSVADAQASGHSLSLCYALGHAGCAIALLTGDIPSMLLEHSARHELPLWQRLGRCFNGILHLRLGDKEGGLLLIGTAMGELRGAGIAVYCKATVCEYAEYLGCVGQIVRAEAEIDQALAQCSHHEELWCLPELLRVKGELSLLTAGPTALPVAERHFQKSLALARKQTSLSWELRTAMSLFRLRTQQCREKEAQELLAPTFARFTEGFGTPDVRSAKLLLDELNQGRPS